MNTENIYTENVKNVTMSEETRMLIACMARMNEVFDKVYDIVSEVYGRDLDNVYPSFSDTYFALNKEMRNILSDVIDVKTLGSRFKEI